MPAESRYIGRFAPTPSGPLHFGSLVTAVGSYLDARHHNGQWLLRIEDIDTPRVVAGAADDIQRTLERFNLFWDGDILFQSQRFPVYEQVLQDLARQGLLYACSCSRRQLMAQRIPHGPLGMIYPGHCRDRQLEWAGNSLRLRIEPPAEVSFTDRHFGQRNIELSAQVGDIVLKRRDNIHAYHLAVVVDDQAQGITDIVRGADLLDVSFVHRYLAQRLAYALPRYLHLPLVCDAAGNKLSKQTGAKALDERRPAEQLWQALQFLGQEPPEELRRESAETLLAWGVAHWNPGKLPGQRASVRA